ncbi:hillarin-like [Pomacea canaliculata]|uniref:hillarin-like n=1 Tax=Pomacea canaliculata TaxID=400727 RepID=UPI000D73B574|nr:hillarin-like [Pomacea canaliculata]XP_025111822.1 hillarin-like [Pomacea canaliculata]
MNQDKELWELEDWYPRLCPPETLKEDLLRDEDFTQVDKDARAKLDSPKDSFEKLVQHLTSHLSSDLHKLRAIFVWMGAQNIGCRQQGASCKYINSPEYYLQEATKNKRFIGKMFAKMCRAARIPCLLVNGKAKGGSYQPGDVDVKGQCTWAIVYVAKSWRFVFPLWAFLAASGYQKENLVLVEDSGKPIRTRLTGSAGTTMPKFDELYFLTDPEVMNYICHPHEQEKQLLPEPLTKEKFYDSPFFLSSYFSSGWQLISPLTSVIKSTSGWCLIDLFSPGGGCKLKYTMFYDEGRSGKKFPPKIQTDRYVVIMKRTQQTKSFLVRLPVTGTYKFVVTGDHGGKTARLVAFQIVCDHVPLETLPFPSYPENGFGFGEAAVAAGLSEPSHTEGFVPVKSGDKISIHFKVSIDSAILARLVHSTRTPEQLRANVIVEREDDNATVIATLPADDPEPEYSLEVDSVKIIKETDESITELPSYHVLNYLLTSDKALSAVITDKKKILQWYEDVWSSIINNDSGRLEEVASKVETACITNPMLEKRIRTKKTGYRRMVQELLDCKREMNFERLNRALSRCIAANLQKKDDIEEGKKVLMYLCQKEVEKAVKGNKLEELNACMNKIKHTCVGEAAQQKAWFKEAEKVLSKLEVGQQAMTQSLRTKDDVNVRKPPDHVMDVIVAAFILLGESEDELDTWEKVDAKLRKTNEEQLLNQVSNLNNSSLTRERVDLAKRKMEQAGGTFAEYRTIETLKKQCLEKITFYRTKGSLKRRNLLLAE